MVTYQVARPEHGEGIFGERRRHVRTVRSAAGSRNRPRARLAWLLLAILLVLIALAARAAAAPATRAVDDPIAEAVRYANALTGVDPDAEIARRAPDDPDDQRAGTSSDDEDDGQPGSFGNGGGRGAGGGDYTGNDDDEDDDDEAEARLDGLPADGDAREDEADRDAREDEAIGDAGGGEADGDAREDEVFGDAGGEGAEAGLAEHAGELALLDDEPAGAVAITSDDAGFFAPAAGAVERYEARMRRRRSWILGRLDVGLAWRRRLSEPMHTMSYVSDEVWLLATWRR